MPSNLTPYLKQLFGDLPVVIWGMGREGRSTRSFLQQHLPDQKLIVTDSKPLDMPEYLPPESALVDATILFKSPGISPYTAPVRPPFWSNTKLFLEILHEFKDLWPVTCIGITGTKGKSTTTAVLHHTLQQLGHHAWLGGNIGVPPLDLLSEIETFFTTANNLDTKSFVVLELSSHQLLDVSQSPDIAVVQALSPEHLDYYPDVSSYYAAKQRIVEFQHPYNQVLFNADSSAAAELVSGAPSQKIGFSIKQSAPQNSQPDLNVRAKVEQGSVTFDNQVLFDVSESPLLGEHNLYNLLPAVVIGGLLGHNQDQITSAIRSFRPLPHRLEPIAEIEGRLFVNDSMSTTPEATQAALAAFAGRPVILIAGGYERHQDYSQLATQITQQSVTAVLAFPTTGQRLLDQVAAAAAASHTTAPVLEVVTDMPSAVALAKKLAPPTSVVLMSPGAASFNLFRDFADRGQQFAKAVRG